MGKSGKTVSRKAKIAKKETVRATQPVVINPVTAANSLLTANSKDGGKVKKKKDHKSQQGHRINGLQGMRARESDERKTVLRNRIEIKRLQSQVQKTKDIVEGREGDLRVDAWKYNCGKDMVTDLLNGLT
jgi:hypothetical protein